MGVTLLDGPTGTELAARGVALPAPLWSAAAIDSAPSVLLDIHRDYADAGASIHTAATFRTTPAAAGPRWQSLLYRAVQLARQGARPGQKVAGSLAPLADCYRPDLSPPAPHRAHAQFARALVDAGVDLVLCETFPHVGEGLAAVEAAVPTGIPVWVSFTAGYRADLMTPATLAQAARAAVARGAAAVLVNCVPAARTLPYVRALADAVGEQVPFGAYANAGTEAEGIGWSHVDTGAAIYAQLAQEWVAEGATLIGGCCGTGPLTLRAVQAALADNLTQAASGH